MITNGFTYVATLVFIAGSLVVAEKYAKNAGIKKFFKFVPPVVLLYLLGMVFCSIGLWDLGETSAAYSNLKNNLLFAMIFLMLLRCDIRQILKLGPRMLGGFFAASLTICIGFVVTYAFMHSALGAEAWKSLGSLCGSWIGGSGNLVAVSTALEVSESELAKALVVDSIDYSIWVMFLLWVINFAMQFNKWTKADTSALDEVSRRLEESAKVMDKEITFPGIIFLLGLGLLVSALSQVAGGALRGAMPFLDKTTWIVLVVTTIGLVGAVTPVTKIPGYAELSNVLLYVVIALLASRADLAELGDAPVWIISGFMILFIHGALLLLLAKIFKLDLFTCGVASLANIGGTASAPVLAAAYSGSLVPVGVLMALMGYVVGTPLGLVVARIMSVFG